MGKVIEIPDYPTAVAAADLALEALLSALRNPDGTYGPHIWTWGLSETDRTLTPWDKVGSMFFDWLYEHPAVDHVLQAECEFEGVNFEDYIDWHSKQFDIEYFEDESAIIRPHTP